MSGIRPENLGRTPRDRTRTRRMAQRLSQLQIGTDGSSIVLDDNGNLTVQVSGVLEVTPDGVQLRIGDGLHDDEGDLAVEPADDSIDVGETGVQVRRDPNGGIGLSEEGILVFGGIPIRLEVPTGVIDGSNATFNLSNLPQEGEVLLFHNGLLLFDDENGDYERDETAITYVAGAEPEVGDRHMAVYLEGIGAAGEVPAGTIDGVNAAFELSADPRHDSVLLFHNGVFMTEGGGADYTLDERTITFNAGGEPQPGDRLFAAYEQETGA